ncbi:MAG: DUF4918 domain-containing protein [Bacteroidetes bacterium]|nr:MAG: DUF4918 domain-containing protein [Bacteroidota bacterium]
MNSPQNQSDAIIEFLKGLKPNLKLPPGIEVMNPFLDQEAFDLTKKFYRKFYSDHHPRIMIFGINPGRFGGGITGVPFTDPVKLQDQCGIQNDYKKVRELSADFVYEFIDSLGGPAKFYSNFFISAVCPLGFTSSGKNMNYYDEKKLFESVEPFIIECFKKQKELITSVETCICLGEGTNFKFFSAINEKHHFFERILPLPHPRWIMQYRKKSVLQYVELYRSQMQELIGEFF